MGSDSRTYLLRTLSTLSAQPAVQSLGSNLVRCLEVEPDREAHDAPEGKAAVHSRDEPPGLDGSEGRLVQHGIAGRLMERDRSDGPVRQDQYLKYGRPLPAGLARRPRIFRARVIPEPHFRLDGAPFVRGVPNQMCRTGRGDVARAAGRDGPPAVIQR